MPVKTYKPTTPGRRGMTSQDFGTITTKRPVKSLLAKKSRINGRNNKGRITVRHRGGGVKRFYRLVDFNLESGFKAKVEHIEYDPNRTSHIARIKTESGQYAYILAPQKIKVGQTIQVGEEVPIESGNRLPLKSIPVGSIIHNIELRPGRGGQIVRSAGANAQFVAKEGKYAQIKLPSGEVRAINLECMASLGVIGNEQHQNVKLGKAGRVRRKGIRPTVRGVVMNAADHPHGGGDGGRHGMGKDPRTPWGQKTLGYKTRTRKSTSKYIVRSRHAGKRR